MKKYELFLTCPKGLELVCKSELSNLRISESEIADGGVSFKGTIHDIYNINLCSRTGMNLLVKMIEFKFKSTNDFYKYIYKYDWNIFINPKMSFSVDNVVINQSSAFNNSQFINLKAKDAICDKIKKIRGKRPDVDKNNPQVNIKIVIDGEICRVYANSSGKALYVRGYKKNHHKASINESLASSLIFLSNWNIDDKLLDPMCGSGTICLEAAMIKRRIPSGIMRSFSFQNWLNYDHDLYLSITRNLIKQIDEEKKNTIFGSDIDAQSIEGAKTTSQSFKYNLGINLKIKNITNLDLSSNHHIITNPPYQIRIGDENMVKGIHRGFKKILNSGSKIHLIYPLESDFIENNYDFKKLATIYNGPIKCGFYKIKNV